MTCLTSDAIGIRYILENEYATPQGEVKLDNVVVGLLAEYITQPLDKAKVDHVPFIQ
jgi:hypothetical protein